MKITRSLYFNPFLQKFENGEFDFYQKEKMDFIVRLDAAKSVKIGILGKIR
jgi:hypothetical protein